MGKLYAIDPHCETDWNDTDSTKSYEIMLAHLARAGVTGFVEMIRTTSAEAASTWHRKIDILFIDGDHSYEGVKKDWELFSPHVSEFGIVVFHDTTWDLIRDGSSPYKRDDMGVPKFVEELRKSGYPIITANKDCGVSIVQPRIGGVALNHDQT
jgi:predicted O-methyltransferase YrrM